MPAVQKTWVHFKHFFQMSHRDLRKTSDLNVEDAGIYHSKMDCDVVAGLHEDFQQEHTQTKILTSVQAPVDQVAHPVKITQQQLATKL